MAMICYQYWLEHDKYVEKHSNSSQKTFGCNHVLTVTIFYFELSVTGKSMCTKYW